MPETSRLPLRLWLLAGLVLAEPLLLGVWFDGDNLAKLGGGAAIVANASVLLRVGSAALLALIVILTARQTSLHDEKSAMLTHDPSLVLWAGHVASYAVLVATSTQVFILSGQAAQAVAPTPSWTWLLLWLVSATLTALTFCSLVAPLDAWKLAFRRHLTVSVYSLVLGVLTWLLGLVSDQLWGPLGGATLEATARLLDIIEPEILVHPEDSVIATPHFGVEVAPECSGFEGMGLMATVLLVVVIAGRSHLRIARVLALLPIALATMWLTNAFRIAALVWLGTHVSPTLAMGAFHSKAGWFLFCAVALGLLSVIRRSAFFQQVPTRTVTEPNTVVDTYNPTFVYLLPFIVQLGTALLTTAFAADVDLAYGARIVTIGAALWYVRRDLPSLTWNAHWVPVVAGVLGYGLWVALHASTATSLGSQEAALTTLQNLPPTAYLAWLVARVVGSAVFVPLAEELAFRGFLLPRLIDADFTSVSTQKLTLVAIVGSALAFGLLHDAWLAGTACGIVFALARWYRGRLSDAIVAHGLTNALLAGDVLWRDHWYHWL